MSLPFFFIEEPLPAQTDLISLAEETSKHIVQVLRMKKGEALQLTDGKGNLSIVEIVDANKKSCAVKVKHTSQKLRSEKRKTIGISLLKNAARFEWLLEKCAETGITSIVPLICERTEKQQFRFERMKNILVSAMLQSQQAWLPELKHPTPFTEMVGQNADEQKFIAHCLENEKISLATALQQAATSSTVLVGPEGDFTKVEIEFAIQHHFIPVTLGETRLRSETAGITAAVLLANL